ncbi:MAG: MFS transporter [Planctomycetaceae bacterium]
MKDTLADSPLPDDERSLYGRTFWWAYVANLLLVAANAITFRFAEYVNFLGGSEEVTGSIVRAGVIGSIVMRLTLARDLDRLGVRRMWLATSLLFVAGCLLTLGAQDVGWQIYVARVAYTIGLAGMFACSNVHIQSSVPLHRRTEMIASLGSSGFLGMMVGAQVGDLLFELLPRSAWLYQALFGTTLLLGLLYTLIIFGVTRRDQHVHQPDTPPPWTLLWRYWPGPVVVVAFAVGVCFVASTVFLTRQATALGLVGVRTYFTSYAITAFAFRLLSRTWSRSLGRHRMMLLGLGGHVGGQLLLIGVDSEWDFILPALCGGFGHALLFPCVVSLGTEKFPNQYRGTGTTLILGCIDVGMALAAQPLGWVIDHYGFTQMYLTTAGFCVGTFVFYGALRLNAPDADREHQLAAIQPANSVGRPSPAPEAAPCGSSESLLPVSARPR